MNKVNRKSTIEQIKKLAELNKVAQEAIETVNESGDTEDYGHKIFLELLNNVKIKGFEDLD